MGTIVTEEYKTTAAGFSITQWPTRCFRKNREAGLPYLSRLLGECRWPAYCVGKLGKQFIYLDFWPPWRSPQHSWLWKAMRESWGWGMEEGRLFLLLPGRTKERKPFTFCSPYAPPLGMLPPPPPPRHFFFQGPHWLLHSPAWLCLQIACPCRCWAPPSSLAHLKWVEQLPPQTGTPAPTGCCCLQLAPLCEGSGGQECMAVEQWWQGGLREQPR